MMPTAAAAQKPRARSVSSIYPAHEEFPPSGQLKLQQLVQRELLTLKPEATLRDTLFALNQSTNQAAVVAEAGDVPLGIVTLHDIIEAITLRRADLDSPTFGCMIAAPLTLPMDASVHRARITLTRSRVDHLLLVDTSGKPHSLLAASDLPGFREGGADELVAQIARVSSVDGMVQAANLVRARAAELFACGMGVEPLTLWLSSLNDLISIRVIELVADEFDLPPVSWCWMVFGSEGRLEQAFASDQDNGLIFKPDNPDETATVRAAFLPFANAVNKALDLCGFPACPGNIMASNPELCLSADEWRQRFARWLAEPEPEALLNAAIFFDFRPLYGQHELCDELTQCLQPRPAQHPRFLRLMCEEALRSSPALGLVGNFAYDGGHLYPHTIDLKSRGSRLFVDVARIWALQHAVSATSTLDRLRATAAQLHRSGTDTLAAIEAFEFIQRLRMQRQLAGGDSDAINRLDPGELTAAQRMMLKEAFRQAKLLQLRLRQDHLQYA